MEPEIPSLVTVAPVGVLEASEEVTLPRGEIEAGVVLPGEREFAPKGEGASRR